MYLALQVFDLFSIASPPKASRLAGRLPVPSSLRDCLIRLATVLGYWDSDYDREF